MLMRSMRARRTIFWGEVFFQDVGGVLDLAASGAGQIAAEQRLEHEHERIALASGQLLAQNVGGHCPHLGYGNCHCLSFPWRISFYDTGFWLLRRWSLVVSR